MREPPQAPPSFESTTAASIEDEVQSILNDSTVLQDHLAATITPTTATFANLVRPLLDDANKAKRRTIILTILLSRNSPDPEVRVAARNAQKRIDAEGARCLLRSDIASLIAAVLEKENDRDELDEEDRHALAHLYGRYLRAGANLQDDAKKTRLQEARSEISKINASALKGFTEVQDGIWFTRDELAGCAESWLAKLKRDVRADSQDEIFWVTFRDDHLVYVQQYAKSEDTRKRIFLGDKRQFPENIERLSKVVTIRDEIARLLGYKNHAALRMQDTMMKSVKNLQERLLSLHARLYPLAMVETSELAALKASDELRKANDKTTEDDIKIYSWDRNYYVRVRSELQFAVDTVRFSEYYEIGHVLSEMLKVFGEIFGMEFVPMPHLSTWHESVSPFSVWNSTIEAGGFLGYLYLDIYGRPAKFNSQYHSRIQPGFTEANGTHHYPVSALICSYPKSTPESPSLLQHRDVRILFHELGHAIHHLVSRTKYATKHSRDFNEIPSNMLEHFIWIPEVMSRLSRHYKTLPDFRPKDEGDIRGDTAEVTTIPMDLARAVARTKTLNKATGMLSLMLPALFDLAIYTPETAEEARSMDTTAMWNDLSCQYLPYHFPENELTFGQASFSPHFRGTDVGYFKYIISQVYAADLYETIFAKGPLSPEAGRRWRYEVLERGSSQPELEMLERFLGRPLSVDVIFEQIAKGRGT